MSRAAGRTVEVSKPVSNGNGNGNGHVVKPRRVQKRVAPTVTAQDRISSGDKHLEWVPVSKMRISETAQRRHDSASSRTKIEDIARNFDPDKFGTLTVNLRDGTYWVIDGGHRYLSLLEIGWEDQSIQCWTYEGLSESDESDKFLALNDTKPVSPMDKFKQAVNAKRPVETDIDKIVRAADLRIGSGRDCVGCVGTVQKIYANAGGTVLATTLRVIRDSFGHPGFNAKVTEGTAMFVTQYESTFKEDLVIARLSAKKGGVVGLLGEAERIAAKYDASLATAVAVAIVETYNRGRSGPRLSTWWSNYAEAD